MCLLAITLPHSYPFRLIHRLQLYCSRSGPILPTVMAASASAPDASAAFASFLFAAEREDALDANETFRALQSLVAPFGLQVWSLNSPECKQHWSGFSVIAAALKELVGDAAIPGWPQLTRDTLRHFLNDKAEYSESFSFTR